MCWIGQHMCICMYIHTHTYDGMNFSLRMQHDILFLMRNGVFGVQKLLVSLHLVMNELLETSASCKDHSCSAGPQIHYSYGTRIFITMFTRAYHWIPSWARSVHSTHTHAYPMFHDPLYNPFLLASNINFKCLSHEYMSTICHLYITFINLITLIWSVVYKACIHLFQ